MALSQAQLEARKHGLGGSDAAVIFGLSSWKSPYDLYLEKTQPGDDAEASERMRWGNLLEPVVANEFATRTKKLLRPAMETVYHPEHKFLLANPDYYIDGENAGLEIKTTAEWHSEDWGMEGTDEIPPGYLVQGLHYAAVCGWEKVYFAALIGGNRMRSYTIDVTPTDVREFMDEMIEREVTWWREHILAKKAPPRPNEILNKEWSKTNGKAVEVDDEIAERVRELRDVKTEIKELEREEAALQSVVKEILRDYESITFAGKKLVSWKYNKSSMKPDLVVLARDHPDVYKQILREVPGPRVLRLS